MIKKLFQLFVPKTITFEQILKEYFAKRATENLSRSTLDKHGFYYQNITEFLNKNDMANQSIKKVRIKTMLQMEAWLHANLPSCSVNHASRHIKHCQAAFDLAVQMEYCKYNPIALIAGKHDPPKEVVSLDINEIIKVFFYQYKTETERHVAVLFLFQCFTGLSYMDLWIYQIVQDKEEKDLFWVTSSRGRGKNKKPYWAQFNPWARQLHEAWNGQMPVVGNQVYNKTIKRIARQLGITKELTSHVARKTYATLRYEQGMSLEAIADELGNTVDVLQKHYITKSAARIRAEINRLNGVPFLDINLKEYI